MPRRGFYLIVDPEHRRLGALPPTMWIDDLMRFHEVPYYVRLLSAAALHGAAHQQPQEFQVVAGAVLRPLAVGRVRMRFFFRLRMDEARTQPIETASGPIPVSTAAMTAFDLLRYRKGTGSLDHVATVLAELAEQIDARQLLAIARKSAELPLIQRLGWLLEHTGHEALTTGLARLVDEHTPKFVKLEPRSTQRTAQRDERWRVLVNTSIEVEA